MDIEEILSLALFYYGKTMQETMIIEEMAELTKEICKNQRGRNNIEKITEEIADVFIMLQQALMIYNIEQKSVDEIVDKKLNRLQNMIDKEFGGRII